MSLRSIVKTKLPFAITVCTVLLACSVAQAKGGKSKFGLTEEQTETLRSRANRKDWRAAEALKAAKQFTAEEKFKEADKCFKQAEELMLAHKGDQFFLKIVYKAQLAYLVKQNKTVDSEAVFAKLEAAKLRIPQSPNYECDALGPSLIDQTTGKINPTLPDGPPIPDDQ